MLCAIARQELARVFRTELFHKQKLIYDSMLP